MLSSPPPGMWVWALGLEGEPWGWGWLGSSILPEPCLYSPTALIRVGDLYPALGESSGADSSRVPFGSCKGLGSELQ